MSARVILVAQRQVQHEVLVARDAEPRELVGERRGLRAFFAPALRACAGATLPDAYVAVPARAGLRDRRPRHQHAFDLDPRRPRQRRHLVGRARRIRRA